MNDLRICRICLITETKMFELESNQLRVLYESITSSPILHDGLPLYICFECTALLRKYHKFKEKCHMGLLILQGLLWNNTTITYESVKKINRKENNLTSSLKQVNLNVEAENNCYNYLDLEIKQETDVLDNDNIDMDVRDDAYDSMYFNDDDDNIPIHNFVTNNINNVCVELPLAEVKKEENQPKEKVKKIQKKNKLKTTIKSKPRVKTKKENSNHKKEKTNGNTIDRRKRQEYVFNLDHWRIQNLTEEEAEEAFRARSNDPRYKKAPYKCLDCFKGFSHQHIYDRHLKLRHTDAGGKFPCRICKIRFINNGKRSYHIPDHYTKFDCLRCTFICTNKSSARFHDEAHNGVIRKCKYCGEEFRHSSSYYTHLRVIHRSEFVCKVCGISFVSRLGLTFHKKRTHFDSVHRTKAATPPQDTEPVKTYCDLCEIRFDSRAAYDQHLLHSTKHEEDFEKLRKSNNQPLLRGLKGHRRSYRGQRKKPTTCNHCGKHFDTRAACMEHHLSEHPRQSFYAANERIICEICGASLSPNSIHAHVNAHLKTKLYPCDTCGRQFHASAVLKRHLLTHTGEKPYPCSLCDKRFTQSNSMKLHYRTFHLKEPYPKRDRRRKKDLSIDHDQASEDSEEVAALATRGQQRLQYFNTQQL